MVAAIWLTAVVAGQESAIPRIGAKDQLRVTVVGVERLAPGPYLVDADGQIDYPMLGRITVRGMTPREAGDDISRRLVAAGLLVGAPQVLVDVQAGANRVVSVTGSVRTPGSISYSGTMTVFDALVRAGMTTSDAGDEVLVIHPIAISPAGETPAVAAAGGALESAAEPGDPVDNDNVVKLSLRDVELGDPAANITLRDGDRVYVPRAESVYITGQVASPGAYTVRSGMTLLQALTLAGGISERGSTRGIKIQRLVDGKQTEVEDVNMETPVRPGDTIIVGRRIL